MQGSQWESKQVFLVYIVKEVAKCRIMIIDALASCSWKIY